MTPGPLAVRTTASGSVCPPKAARSQPSLLAQGLQPPALTKLAASNLAPNNNRMRMVAKVVEQAESRPSTPSVARVKSNGLEALDGIQRSPSPSPEAQRSSLGYLALFGVAVLWGSYTPAIRLLYGIETPPDPALLNSLQACLSAAFLLAANVTARITNKPSIPHPERSNPLMAEDSALREATIRRDRADKRKQSENGGSYAMLMEDPPRRPPANALEHVLAGALNWRSNNLALAGAEVGLWMCLAFGLEVAGLQLASATKVAFLNQVSVLITPLLVHLSGERVRKLEWLACGLGLLGSVLVAADSLMSGGGGGHHGAVVDAAQSNEVLGLTFVLISSVFFALSTVRLGRYSTMFDALELSTTSTSTLGLLSLTWVAASVLGRADGATYELTVIDNMLASSTCVLTLLWVGLGPGALAAYLQAIGQQQVPPAQAQVIYSTTPLWAAGFALLALDAKDEAMGGIAWVGAAIMLGSSLMTALLPPEQPPQPPRLAGPGDDYSDMEMPPPGDGEFSRPYRSLDDPFLHHTSPYEGLDPEVRDRQGLRDIL